MHNEQCTTNSWFIPTELSFIPTTQDIGKEILVCLKTDENPCIYNGKIVSVENCCAAIVLEDGSIIERPLGSTNVYCFLKDYHTLEVLKKRVALACKEHHLDPEQTESITEVNRMNQSVIYTPKEVLDKMTTSDCKTTKQQDNEINHYLRVKEAYATIVAYFNRDNQLDQAELANFAGTADRAAKALVEMTRTKTEICEELRTIINVSFPNSAANAETQRGIITQGPILLHSFCPHHLLPVHCECFISYLPLPQGQVLGLSKIARAAKLLAMRPVLQEQLVEDIADVFYHQEDNTYPGIESEGSCVQIVAKHSCMSERGIECDASTSTTAVRGIFSEPNMELRFFQTVGQIRKSRE